jgi:lipopolysaccharide transport system ATP-binding protein
MEVQVEIYTPFSINGCRIALKASDSNGKKAFYVWAYDSEKPMCRREGFHKVVFNFPAIRLFQGEYKLELRLAERIGGQRFEKIEGICPFSVAMRNAREGGYEPNEASYVEQFEWRAYEKGVEGDETSAV